MGTKEAIQRNLKYLMESTNTKNVDLARAVGVTKGSVTNWLNGRNSIDMDIVPKICSFFNVSVDEFLDVRTRKTLSPDENDLIETFRKSSFAGKQRVLEYSRMIAREFPISEMPGQ